MHSVNSAKRKRSAEAFRFVKRTDLNFTSFQPVLVIVDSSKSHFVRRLWLGSAPVSALFGLVRAWFDLIRAWFDLIRAWFGLVRAWFDLIRAWFGLVWFGLV